MANTTASARGTNRNLATPVRKNIGTNAIQIQIVETKAGTAIWCEPSRMAASNSLPCASRRSMFSIATVASSTRIPTARARPPKVMMLMDCPRKSSRMIEIKMDRGIEIEITIVGRQSPRKRRIMAAVSAAAISPSRTTPAMAARTKTDWSNNAETLSSGGSDCDAWATAFFTPSTIVSVEALPTFNMDIRAPRWPSMRTMLVWGANPSRMWATSRM